MASADKFLGLSEPQVCPMATKGGMGSYIMPLYKLAISFTNSRTGFCLTLILITRAWSIGACGVASGRGVSEISTILGCKWLGDVSIDSIIWNCLCSSSGESSGSRAYLARSRTAFHFFNWTLFLLMNLSHQPFDTLKLSSLSEPNRAFHCLARKILAFLLGYLLAVMPASRFDKM